MARRGDGGSSGKAQWSVCLRPKATSWLPARKWTSLPKAVQDQLHGVGRHQQSQRNQRQPLQWAKVLYLPVLY